MVGGMTVKFPKWWLLSNNKSSSTNSVEEKSSSFMKTKTGTWNFKLRNSTSMSELLKQ